MKNKIPEIFGAFLGCFLGIVVIYFIDPKLKAAPKGEAKWVGEVAVGSGDEWFHNVSYMPNYELGLRPDGVCVWRLKSNPKASN